MYGTRKDKRPIAEAILKRFEKQKTRGLQGFGYIPVEKGHVKRIVRAETEEEIKEKLGKEKSNEILFHHRAPTGGTPNIEELTHPIEVKSDILEHNYFVVHNGVIRNADELKKKHEKIGFKYTTEITKTEVIETRKKKKTTSYESQFNDTEALAIELALYFDNKQKKIETKGAVAFICFETDKKGKILKLHYGRNTNPLTVEENGDLFFLRSEGGKSELTSDRIVTVDYFSKESVENHVDVGESYAYSSATRSNYNWHSASESEDDEKPPVGTPVRNQDIGEPTYLEYLYTPKHVEALQEEIDALEIDIENHTRMVDIYHKKETLTNADLETFIYHEEALKESKDIIKQKREDLEQIEQYIEDETAQRQIGFNK